MPRFLVVGCTLHDDAGLTIVGITEVNGLEERCTSGQICRSERFSCTQMHVMSKFTEWPSSVT